MNMRALLAGSIVALVLMPAAVLAHGGTEVTVQGEVTANAEINLAGEEFAPNDVVRIELRKEGTLPIGLGSVRADADGAFSISLHVPSDVEPGLYILAAEGNESAEAEVTVLAAEEAGGAEPDSRAKVSSDRPTSETVAFALLAAVLAAGGVALLWVSRTRPHHEPP